MQKLKFDYPIIEENLIRKLRLDFPDTIPRTYKTEFEYGVLVGIQKVIDKLLYEYKEQQKGER